MSGGGKSGSAREARGRGNKCESYTFHCYLETSTYTGNDVAGWGSGRIEEAFRQLVPNLNWVARNMSDNTYLVDVVGNLEDQRVTNKGEEEKSEIEACCFSCGQDWLRRNESSGNVEPKNEGENNLTLGGMPITRNEEEQRVQWLNANINKDSQSLTNPTGFVQNRNNIQARSEDAMQTYQHASIISGHENIVELNDSTVQVEDDLLEVDVEEIDVERLNIENTGKIILPIQKEKGDVEDKLEGIIEENNETPSHVSLSAVVVETEKKGETIKQTEDGKGTFKNHMVNTLMLSGGKKRPRKSIRMQVKVSGKYVRVQ